MNLADVPHVQVALGRELTSQEQTRAEGLLPEASDLVWAWLQPNPDWTDLSDVPPVVTRVTARMVARVITAGVESVNLSAQTTVVGPYQRQNTFNPDATSGGPWLTRVDKIALRPYRRGYVQNFSTH